VLETTCGSGAAATAAGAIFAVTDEIGCIIFEILEFTAVAVAEFATSPKDGKLCSAVDAKNIWNMFAIAKDITAQTNENIQKGNTV
jgi:hypothetical protein